MANKGFVNSTAYNGRYIKFEWETISQNTTDNSSVISWRLVGAGGPQNYYYGSASFKVILDGKTIVDYDPRPEIQLYAGTVVKTGQTTIKHNEDGNKKFPVHIEAGIYYYSQANCKGDKTFELDKIERYAYIVKAPDFTDEENPTFQYKNPTGGIVEACLYFPKDGEKPGQYVVPYAEIPANGTSYTFNLSPDQRQIIQKRITNAKYGQIGFYVRSTVKGNRQEQKVLRNVTIANAEPSLVLSVRDVNPQTVNATGNNQILIKNASNAEVIATPTIKKFATISKSRIQHNNGESINGLSGRFEATTGSLYVAELTDSRGYEAVAMKDISLLDYERPTAELTCTPLTAGGQTTLNIRGVYFPANFGRLTNQLTLLYRQKEENGSFSSWVAMPVSPMVQNRTYTAYFTVSGFDYRKRYTVQVKAIDAITEAFSQEVEIQSIPVFSWSKNDFAFNVPVFIEGNPVADFVIEQGTKGVWMYRKWQSGIAECWGYCDVNGAIDAAFGSIYYGCYMPADGINYPFEFKEIPREVASYVPTFNTTDAWIMVDKGNGTTHTGRYYLGRPTSTTAKQDRRYNIYVMGKYK